MNKEAINRLLREIKENSHKKVIVYSLDGCPMCTDVKTKLDKIGVVYETITMNGNDGMWDKVAKMGGTDYAPQVQINNYLIKENEYKNAHDLIGVTLTRLLNRKIVIK